MAEFYRDVPHKFVFETVSHDARYGFQDGRFTGCYMADCTYNREICSDRFAYMSLRAYAPIFMVA